MQAQSSISDTEMSSRNGEYRSMTDETCSNINNEEACTKCKILIIVLHMHVKNTPESEVGPTNKQTINYQNVLLALTYSHHSVDCY